MKNQKQTIRRIVNLLNNPEEDGGFWLPNIQRPFVWSEEQICRLFDSILREYPISTLLVWKTTSDIRRRKFIENWYGNLKLSHFYVNGDDRKKSLVLDGQQRLQSLYIALKGSYDEKELHFDILSGEVSAPDDIKYEFRFIKSDKAFFPWVNFKALVFSNVRAREIEDEVIALSKQSLSNDQIDKIKDHIDVVRRCFTIEDIITYQELDSIDNPKLYTEDDVVEVFIRANSGGTRLGKSDLLFSLLNASWDYADRNMEELLDALNAKGFAFDRDFVLKTCLVLLGEGARYEVSKFRKSGVRDQIEARWEEISQSIRDVLDWIYSKTYIQCDKALTSYLALIPLIYLRYHNKPAWKSAKNVDKYLLRCLLAGVFSGQPDSMIDVITAKLASSKYFDIDEIFAVIRTQGRNVEITEDRLWQMGYGSDAIHLLFNLWYKDFNQTPSYENNLPQIDHIFAQSILKTVKIENVSTSRRVMKFRPGDRNQLANCMLLSREENGAGGKSDTSPADWFTGKSEVYLRRHMIPQNRELWQVDMFEEFIAERKVIMLARFREMELLAAV